MKVHHPASKSVESATSIEHAKRSERADRARDVERQNQSHETSDVKSEISSRARDMAKAKEIAKSAAEIREAKIAELKRRIQNRDYNVKPDDVASRMVDEHIQTKGIG